MSALPAAPSASMQGQPVIDLVDELDWEDKAMVPVVDLTANSDEEGTVASSAVADNAPALAGWLPLVDEEEDVEESVMWPVLPSAAHGNDDMPNPYSDARPVATLARSLGDADRRSTRWGRCDRCGRALRPGVSATGSPVLMCAKFKRGEGHSYRRLHPGEAEELGLPTAMLRRIRVLW